MFIHIPNSNLGIQTKLKGYQNLEEETQTFSKVDCWLFSRKVHVSEKCSLKLQFLCYFLISQKRWKLFLIREWRRFRAKEIIFTSLAAQWFIHWEYFPLKLFLVFIQKKHYNWSDLGIAVYEKLWSYILLNRKFTNLTANL